MTTISATAYAGTSLRNTATSSANSASFELPLPPAPKQPSPPQTAEPTPAPASMTTLTTGIFGQKLDGKGISIDQIEAYAHNATKSAKEAIDSLFSRYNIPKHPPTEFKWAPDGRIIIENGQNKLKIEQALAENPETEQKITKSLAFEGFTAEIRQYEIYLAHYANAYKTGGIKAMEAVTLRYLNLPSPSFSLNYGLSGIAFRVDGGSVADWLAHTNIILG